MQFLPPCTRNFRTIFIRHLGVSKWLEDRNFDFSRVIGKNFCTPYINLVRFGSVTPDFKTYEVVQSASKFFSAVTSGTFIEGGWAARQGGDQ